MYARPVRTVLSAMLLAACHRSAPAPLPAACDVVDHVFAQYEDCRRAHPDRWPLEAVTEHRHALRDLYATMPAARASRMCAFEIDHLRFDMSLENCVPALTAAEQQQIADAKLPVTAAPRTADPANQPIVDAIARARDRDCTCADKACVEAADADVERQRLEQLKPESQAVHDTVDAILSESYDCATRPQIISADVWVKVPPIATR